MHSVKRIAGLTIFLALSASMGPLAAHADDQITIGVSSSLTGVAASYGADVRNGLLFANEKFMNGRYRFVIEDDQCAGKKAADVAQKLTRIDRVRYVLGFPCSGPLLSAAPIYERNKVVVIASGASAPAISDAGDYIFRTWASDKLSSRALYEYVQSRHRVFGVVSEQTEYAQGIAKAFAENNSAGKLELVTADFLSSESDFRTLLLRLQAKSIDGIFLNTQAEDQLINLLKQFRALDLKIPVYAAFMPGSESFLKQTGKASDGIVFVNVPGENESFTKDGKAIFNEFTARYGKPNAWAFIVASAMESLRALDQAIRSGDDVRKYLYTHRFQGIFGEYWFDAHGDIQGVAPIMQMIRDGKIVPAA